MTALYSGHKTALFSAVAGTIAAYRRIKFFWKEDAPASSKIRLDADSQFREHPPASTGSEQDVRRRKKQTPFPNIALAP
jgi:hypothetical protein